MRGFVPLLHKFVKTLLLFGLLKMALNWWRIGFGSFAVVLHNCSGILAEAFCFAIVWMVVIKIRKPNAEAE